MKAKHIFFLFCTMFLEHCNNCEKLNLTKNQRDWVTHFKEGQQFLYKRLNGKIDTLICTGTNDYYTPCNKFELSEYQYEIYIVLFKFKTAKEYNGDEPDISVTTQEWEDKNPSIYLGNLGPHRNSLENKMPIAMDTILNGVKLLSVYYYSQEVNTEEYGDKKYFKNFFWSKEKGLIAYTTFDNEIYLVINN